MLVIRKSQMKSLTKLALHSWMADHLRQCFPAECAALGEARLDERIDDGIASALSYGFEEPVHISQYIDLTFAIGPDFDIDPALTWPDPILSHPDLSPARRMELLIEAALSSRQRP